MYLNQFTNTKRITYGRRARTLTLTVNTGWGEYLQYVCLFYKMTYDILFHTLSASKMSSTSYNSTKKGRKTKKNKSQFHKEKPVASASPPKTLQHQYLCRIFTGFKYILPLLSIESHLKRVTRGWVWTYWRNASDTSGQQRHEGGRFNFISIHKYLHYFFFLIYLYWYLFQ